MEEYVNERFPRRTRFVGFPALVPYLPLIVAAIFAVVFFRAWYFGAGYLTFGDWRVVLPQSGIGDFPSATLWRYNTQVGFPFTNFYPFYSAFALLAHVHVGFPIAERLLFFVFFVPVLLAGYWYLAYVFTGDRVAASVAGFVAFFNSEVLLPGFGGHTNATNSIALAPWALLGAYQAVRTRSIPWLAVTFVAYFLTCAYDLRWVPPLFVLTVVFALAPLFERSRKSRRFALLAIGTALFGIIAQNLYWMLPRIMGFAVSPAPPAINLQVHWVVASSAINWLDALCSWNPFFVNDFRRAPLISQHIAWFSIVWPILVVVLAVGALRRFRVPTIVALSTYLVGAFLTKGANPPFGGVYVWSFVHVPLFDAYRDPSKFAFLVIIGMSLCVALGLAYLRSAELRTLRNAVAIFVMGFLVLQNAHVVNLIGAGVTAERNLPSSYVRLNSELEADHSFGRVLALPTDSRWMEQTALHPVISGSDIASAEFAPWNNKMVEFTNVPFVYSPGFERLLRWSAVRYVVVDDSVYDDSTIGGLGESIVGLRDALGAMPFLVRVANFGSSTLYRVRGPSPHAWTSDSATYFTGNESQINSLPFVPGLPADEPVVFGRVKDAQAQFRRVISFANSPNLAGAQQSDALAPADSVVDTPLFGVSAIAPQRLAAGTNSRTWIVEGPSSVPLLDRTQTASHWRDTFQGGALLEPPIPAALRFRDANGSVWNFRALRIVNGVQAISIENRMPVAVHGVLRLHEMFGRVAVRIDGREAASYRAGEAVVHLNIPPGHAQMELRPQSGLPFITLTSFSGSVDTASRGAAWRTIRVLPVHLYENPQLDLRLSAFSVAGHYLAALHLRDRRDGRRYVLPLANAQYSGTIDVRSMLWWNILSQRRDANQDQSTNDVYDYFDLDAISLRPLPGSSRWPTPLPSSVSVTLRTPSVKYLNTGATVLNSTHIVRFAVPARPGSWIDHVCSITTLHGEKNVYVIQADGSHLSGIAIDGSPFHAGWDDISSIALTSSVAAYEIPVASLVGTHLLLNARPAASLRYRVVAEISASGRPNYWAAAPESPTGMIDLAGLEGNTTGTKLRRILVFVSRAGNGRSEFVTGPALQFPGGSQIPAQLAIVRRANTLLISSSIGTGRVPVIVGVERGHTSPARTHALHIGAFRTETSFRLASGDRWLVFSEAYASGWQLTDADGRAIGVHERAYGIFNAWFVKGGLNGVYRLVYRPDAIAPIGFWLGIVAFACAICFVAWACFRRKMSLNV